MDSGTRSFSDLLSDRVFHIPNYQRYYSWEEKHLDDLWTDITILEEGKRHYFGTVILQETSDTKETEGPLSKKYQIFKIIDGQQRLTTIAIILKVLGNKMLEIGKKIGKSTDIEDRVKEIERKYHRDSKVYKLKLLDDDDPFFKRHIIDDLEEPREEITPSQRKLWRAKTFYNEKLNELLEDSKDPEEFIRKCSIIKNRIEDLEIMTYPVGKDEEERAILIFESVNDRGRNLSDLDKTKSFLMHMVYLSTNAERNDLENNLNFVRTSFSNIYKHLQQIQDNHYGRNIEEDSIQRFHYIAFARWKSKEEYQNLLDDLKKNIRNTYRENKNEECEQCIINIKKYVEDLETAFQNLKEILDYKDDKIVKESLSRFHALRNEANFYPILISAWSQFKNKKEDLLKILKAIEVFCFRVYTVGNHPTYTGRSSLSIIARDFHNEGKSSDEWKQRILSLLSKYEDDSTFRNKTLRNYNFYHRVGSRDIRFILFFYEKFLGEEEKEPIPIELEPIMGMGYAIEHIWPQNPGALSIDEKWIHDEYKHRLGNLTMATNEWNSKFGKKPFVEKKKFYGESSLRVQRELKKYPKWDKDSIEKRENKIIDFIMNNWSLFF